LLKLLEVTLFWLVVVAAVLVFVPDSGKGLLLGLAVAGVLSIIAVAFVVQRSDALGFAPHEEMDPAFADTLYRAARSGVMVRAYTCRVNLEEIRIAGRTPFHRQP